MTYDLLITDSHVIPPKGMVEKNIVVENGKIELITNDAPDCDKKINGSGLVSIPGLVDPHVHYGVYSPIDQAAINFSSPAFISMYTWPTSPPRFMYILNEIILFSAQYCISAI